MESQKKLAEVSARCETLTEILKDEKRNLHSQIDSLKENSQFQNNLFEKQMLELQKNFESRINDQDKFQENLDGNKEEIKTILSGFKGTLKKQKSRKPGDFTELIEKFEGFFGKIEGDHFKAIKENAILKKEIEISELEKKYQKQFQEAKKLSENAIQIVKNSFYQEIQELKVSFY